MKKIDLSQIWKCEVKHFESEGKQELSNRVRNGDVVACTANTLIRPNEGNGEWRVWHVLLRLAASTAEFSSEA